MTDGDSKSQLAGETNKISQPPLDETLPPSWIRDQQQAQPGDDAEKVSTDDGEGASPAASLSKPLTPDSVDDGLDINHGQEFIRIKFSYADRPLRICQDGS